MITSPALKVKQFGVEFYQTAFTSIDIQKLVKFEVLSYSSTVEGDKKKAAKKMAINWELLERRIGHPPRGLSRT